MTKYRLAWILAIALAAVPAAADRLILLPVGKKVPFRAIKAQYGFDGAERDNSYTTLAFGIGTSFELEVTRDRGYFGSHRDVVDLNYNLNDPVIHYAPGMSVGVRDVFDRSNEGRNLYIAFTYQEGQIGELNMDAPAEGTFGFRVGEKTFFMFIGAYVPYSTQIALLAEMQTDGYFSAGLEYRPTPNANLRWIHRSGQSSWSLGFLKRF